MSKRGSSRGDLVAAELKELNKGNAKNKARLNLGDGAGLKRALDDAAAEALSEQGYVEDHTFSDIKIGVGLSMCALAGIAQYYPKKYPDSFWILVVCVGLYIAATIALNVFLTGIEGEVFYIAKPRGKAARCLASKLPRYSEQYSLIVGSKSNRWSKGLKSSQIKVEKNVTAYFDTEGMLVENAFKADVASAVKQLEKQSKKTK